ncbi:GTPase activating protein (GAP), partial [Friedmanniomyces endolithicus]
ESAHPKSENPKHRAITHFQALMVVAFKEFDGITQHTIAEQRAKHKPAVMVNIESFAKRTSIRNLGPESKKLSANDLGFLYDRFYTVLYERQQRAQMLQAETERRAKAARARGGTGSEVVAPQVEMGRVALGAASSTTMEYDAFREFLAGIARWAVTDSPLSPTTPSFEHGSMRGNGSLRSTRGRSSSASPWGAGPEPADHDFLHRLFGKWDAESRGSLGLQDVVYGLAPVKGGRDLMGSIAWFFELYDDDGDGRVDREGILRMSEGLLFLSRRGVESQGGESRAAGSEGGRGMNGEDGRQSKDEQFLSAVSAFIRRCFEYADPDHPSRQRHEVRDADTVKDLDLLDLTDSNADGPPHPNHHQPPNDAFDPTPLSPKHLQANAALDPSSPVHITLPTFRMLVLADETLEFFFDSGFANSFHLADAPLPSLIVPTTLPFSSTASGMSGGSVGAGSVSGGAAAGVAASPGAAVTAVGVSSGGIAGVAAGAGVMVGPGKPGIRGMLDNIVTDGMRVAAEVRRRMDDAQKELDRGGVPARAGNGAEEDEEDEEEAGDLLEGAEADAGAASVKSLSLSREGSLVDEGVELACSWLEYTLWRPPTAISLRRSARRGYTGSLPVRDTSHNFHPSPPRYGNRDTENFTADVSLSQSRIRWDLRFRYLPLRLLPGHPTIVQNSLPPRDTALPTTVARETMSISSICASPSSDEEAILEFRLRSRGYAPVADSAYRFRRGSPRLKTCNTARAASAARYFVLQRYLGVGPQVYLCHRAADNVLVLAVATVCPALDSVALSPAASRTFGSIEHLKQAKGGRPGPRREMSSQLEVFKGLSSL